MNEQFDVCIIGAGVVGLAILIFGAFVAIQQQVDEPVQFVAGDSELADLPLAVDDEPLEATLVDDVSDGTSS